MSPFRFRTPHSIFWDHVPFHRRSIHKVRLFTSCIPYLPGADFGIRDSWGFVNGFTWTQISLPEILAVAERLHIDTTVFVVLSWTGISAVKLSFLFFFRSLIRRIRKLEILWWIVVAFTFCTWIAGAVAEVFICPHYDQRICMIRWSSLIISTV